mmetsp:Transcript_47910/g.54282  ORF Transcript_47910/g.54282 Transcript_47910/m.54282 type:complete len:336 (-) Transcript_47910:812-1819(-)
MEGPRHSKEVLDNSSNPESVPTSSTATVTGPSRKSPPVAVLVPSKKSPPSAALQSSPMEALVPTGKSLSVAEYVPTPNLVDKKNRQSWGRALHNSTYWQKMNKILFERRRLYLLKRALADLPIFASVFNYYSNNGNKKEPGTYVEVVHPPITYDGEIYPELKDRRMNKFLLGVVRNWEALSDYEKISLLRIPNFDTNFDKEFLENVRLIRLRIKEGKSLYNDKRSRYTMLSNKDLKSKGFDVPEQKLLCRMFHFYLGELQVIARGARKLLSLDQKRVLKEIHFYELFNMDFGLRTRQGGTRIRTPIFLKNYENDIILNNGIEEKFGMIRKRLNTR